MYLGFFADCLFSNVKEAISDAKDDISRYVKKEINRNPETMYATPLRNTFMLRVGCIRCNDGYLILFNNLLIRLWNKV
ncbi:unnamed protein product [Lactuca virosa]|uniref:Uncharacterized protein n=1 Tax=Lactuca virosa TaxID=75947 RepID=A0AAU9NS15_9ASTR|nr:unnamed protein product [Lactuca virosa]